MKQLFNIKPGFFNMSDDYNDSPNIGQTCAETGVCENHRILLERRKTDRKDLTELKGYIDKLFERWDREVPPLKVKVLSVFALLTLLSLISLGSYSYTAISNARTDADLAAVEARNNTQIATLKFDRERAIEVLNNNILKVEKELREEQSGTMAKVVDLLTSDAEQKQWQKGMMKQLEMLNEYLRDMVNNKVLIQKSKGG